MAIKLGTGFKVQSVTIYPGYAQVNGEFIRAAGDVDVVPNNSQSFSVSVHEGTQIASAMEEGTSTFDLALSPQEPDTVTPRAATPASAPTNQ